MFVRSLAEAWTRSYARLTYKPFSIALPDYGSRVAWDSAGRLVSVLSEQPGVQSSLTQKELEADPKELAAFLDVLRTNRPTNLTTVAWFRLPTQDDQRIWSLATLQTVIEGRTLTPLMIINVERDDLGAYRVILSNVGTVDMTLPRTVRAKPCIQADGLAGYTLHHESNGLTFTTRADSKLRVGQRVEVGWTRCASSWEDLSLEE